MSRPDDCDSDRDLPDARPVDRPRPRTAAAQALDAGFTIIVLLVSIALLATAVAALLTAWNQSIRASVLHRDQSEVQTKVVSAVSWIASNDLSFVACTSTSDPSVAVQTAYNAVLGNVTYGAAPWRPDLITVSEPVKFWNPTTEQWVIAEQPEDCPNPSSPLQLVTIRVVHPSGSTSTEIEVVKSDVWAP